MVKVEREQGKEAILSLEETILVLVVLAYLDWVPPPSVIPAVHFKEGALHLVPTVVHPNIHSYLILPVIQAPMEVI